MWYDDTMTDIVSKFVVIVFVVHLFYPAGDAFDSLIFLFTLCPGFVEISSGLFRQIWNIFVQRNKY